MFHVSWHFCNQKCLETGETTKYLEQALFFKGYCCFSCFSAFFCNQKCLETGKIMIFFKGFGRLSVSRHFWIQKVSLNRRNDKISWKLWFSQRIWLFFSVSRHFWKFKVSWNRETTKSLEYRKCLETGKRQNPLNTENVQKQGNDKIPWIRKVPGNRKTTKSFAWAKTSLTRGAERPFRCLDTLWYIWKHTLEKS